MTFSILIIDDDASKIQEISELIAQESSELVDSIHTVANVHEARRELSSKFYDLVILDINLPPRADQRAQADAGLNVLSFLRRNERAIVPRCVVGLTSFTESLTLAAPHFTSPLWKVLHFDRSAGSWKEPIREAIRHLLELSRPPFASDGHTYHTDVAIIVALDEELDSIRALPGSWREITVPFDSGRYLIGDFQADSRIISVVVAAAPKMGMPAAAVTATKTISAFRPRFIAMAGICAGLKGKSKIGDILVADPCFDWGSGKWVKESGVNIPTFQPAPYPWRLEENLRALIFSLGQDEQFRKDIHARYTGKKSKFFPLVKIEAMASGGSVLQTQYLIDQIKAQHKNLVGIEMESYAVFTAAEYSTDPKPACFSVKSVCDFGNEKKKDGYHGYAAYTSAEFLHKIICKLPLPND